MERDKAGDEKIQEYYNLSLIYLESAKASLERELFEPAMFNAIHALELSLKASLLTKISDIWKTHNVGGVFSRYFIETIGKDTCRRINIILSKYNLPRYPGMTSLDREDVKRDIDFIEHLIKIVIPSLF